MRVFAIGSYKGGVGKTTTTVNLAYDLSVKGYRVLVIDTDPQANTTYMYARVNDNTYTLADLFAGSKAERCIYRTKYKNLDLIKGSSRMEEATGDAEVLKDALQTVKERYDYVLIDCHPSMQLPTIAAMIAADELLIPFEPDGYGRNGLIILDDYIRQIREQYNPRLRYHIFISKFAGRASQLRLFQNLIEKYDYPIMDKCIRYREAVNTAIENRKPLLRHRRFDAVTRDYLELTDALLELEKLEEV